MMPLTVRDIAQTCHDLNRAYCLANGDASQPQWFEAPDWQRESAISGVEFHLANPDADDAASHNNWLKDKEADGWKHGPVKDPEKKEHPCMVAFEDLPLDQRIKDKLFRQTVHAMAPLLSGAEMHRCAVSDSAVLHEPTRYLYRFFVDIDSSAIDSCGNEQELSKCLYNACWAAVDDYRAKERADDPTPTKD